MTVQQAARVAANLYVVAARAAEKMQLELEQLILAANIQLAEELREAANLQLKQQISCS